MGYHLEGRRNVDELQDYSGPGQEATDEEDTFYPLNQQSHGLCQSSHVSLATSQSGSRDGDLGRRNTDIVQ